MITGTDVEFLPLEAGERLFEMMGPTEKYQMYEQGFN